MIYLEKSGGDGGIRNFRAQERRGFQRVERRERLRLSCLCAPSAFLSIVHVIVHADRPPSPLTLHQEEREMSETTKTVLTCGLTVAVLSALKAISPGLAWSVAAFGLGWCLGSLYQIGKKEDPTP